MAVPPPERILLVRLSHLGDVVHALPVLHGLRRAFPDAELGWAIQPEFAELVRGLAGARAFLFQRDGGPGAWLRLRRELRAWRPDWAVDAQGNLKSAAVAWCSGARRRIGPARQDWREPLGARILTDQAPPAYGTHALHRMLALMEIVAPIERPSFDLELTDAEREAGEGELARRLPGGARRWILHLGAPGDRRTWPAERFAELARRLAAEGDGVLVLSGPAEAEAGRALASSPTSREDIAHWVGQSGLRALAAFLTAAGAAGARFVGGDSGPAHLAAACGMGVDMLSGPQDPELTGPWPLADERGSPHRVLRASDAELAPMELLSVDRAVERLGSGTPALER